MKYIFSLLLIFFYTESVFSEDSDKILSLTYHIIVNFFNKSEECRGFKFKVDRYFKLAEFKDRSKSIVEYEKEKERIKKDKDRVIANQYQIDFRKEYDNLSNCMESTFNHYYEVKEGKSTIAESDIFFLNPESFFKFYRFFSYCCDGKSDIPLFDFIKGKQDEIKKEIERTFPESLDPSRTNVDEIDKVLEDGFKASQRAISQVKEDANKEIGSNREIGSKGEIFRNSNQRYSQSAIVNMNNLISKRKTPIAVGE